MAPGATGSGDVVLVAAEAVIIGRLLIVGVGDEDIHQREGGDADEKGDVGLQEADLGDAVPSSSVKEMYTITPAESPSRKDR